MASLFRRNSLFFNQFVRYKSNFGVSATSFNIENERKEFLNVLPEVINSVVVGPKLVDLPVIQIRIKKILEYMLGGGKLGRGLMTSIGYRMFEEPENYSEEAQHSARVLGWCTEMLQAAFIMMDDVADDAIIRRGKLCWHRIPNVGAAHGINDSLLLFQSMIELLDIHFGQTPIFGDLSRYFNTAAYRAIIGEHLDFRSGCNADNSNIDEFSMDKVMAMSINKAAYYTFKLPIFTSLLLVKNGKEKANENLYQICMEFGKLMQCQDDYMDAYGDEEVTGKTGTDIQEGKCTWVSVTALQHCNEAQRAIFKQFYASKDPEHVKRIKQLYDELKLPQLYEKWERKICDDIMARIKVLPAERDREFLIQVLNANYKRVS